VTRETKENQSFPERVLTSKDGVRDADSSELARSWQLSDKLVQNIFSHMSIFAALRLAQINKRYYTFTGNADFWGLLRKLDLYNSDYTLFLDNAVQSNQMGLLKFLVETVSTAPRARNLRMACEEGHQEMVEYLLSEAVVSKLALERKQGKDTALHLAIEEGHLEVVKLLVNAGANVMAKGIGRCTPLHLACRNGHVAIVEYLLSDTVRPQLNLEGRAFTKTPLHLAVSFGHLKIVMLLVEAGAEIKATCKHVYGANITALDLAKKYPKITEYLREKTFSRVQRILLVLLIALVVAVVLTVLCGLINLAAYPVISASFAMFIAVGFFGHNLLIGGGILSGVAVGLAFVEQLF